MTSTENAEMWEPADLDDVSLIEVEQDGVEYQVSVVMMGAVNRTKERAFRDAIIADHVKAAALDAALKALRDGLAETQAVTNGQPTDWYWMAQRRRQAMLEAISQAETARNG